MVYPFHQNLINQILKIKIICDAIYPYLMVQIPGIEMKEFLLKNMNMRIDIPYLHSILPLISVRMTTFYPTSMVL